nr:hypothetical protein [Tanacetum cinerariifolium]
MCECLSFGINLSKLEAPSVYNFHMFYEVGALFVTTGSSIFVSLSFTEGVSARKSAKIFPLTELRTLNSMSCSPSSIAHLAILLDFLRLARIFLIEGVSARKSAKIFPLTELRTLNSMSCSPSSIAHLAILLDFLRLARIFLIVQLLRVLKNGRDLSAPYERNWLSSAKFPMRILLKGFPPTIMVLEILVMSAYVYANTSAFDWRSSCSFLLKLVARIVDTMIPIFYIAVLPRRMLYGELDLTMTKFKVSVLIYLDLDYDWSKEFLKPETEEGYFPYSINDFFRGVVFPVNHEDWCFSLPLVWREPISDLLSSFVVVPREAFTELFGTLFVIIRSSIGGNFHCFNLSVSLLHQTLISGRKVGGAKLHKASRL